MNSILIVLGYLYETLILFTFFWAGMAAVALSSAMPKQGIIILIFSILIVTINRIQESNKNK